MDNIGCVIFWDNDKYDKMAKNACSSFRHFHPNIKLYPVNKHTLKNMMCSQYQSGVKSGIMKYLASLEIMHEKKLQKIIILGADTITCAYLSEFIENDEDILVTLDYDYPLYEQNFGIIAQKGRHLNADVVCFNNKQALSDVCKASFKYPNYFEQGGLNEVVWNGKYSHKLVELDENNEINFFYNVRVKGYVTAKPGESPWEKETLNFYSKDGKLYNKDFKQIKVWHYCCGFGCYDQETVENMLYNWSKNSFNPETKFFFTTIGCRHYFTEKK